MFRINAQTDNCVNAETVNVALQAIRMGRQAESEPSPFWRRLAEAWSEQELPTSQNGIAQKLKMSQGSVGRWFHGEGLPELETCIELAERGRVCVDWLITGRSPKYPISRDPLIREIFEICEQLAEPGRTAVLRAARGELLQKQAEEIEAAKARQRRA
jgi:transcriptional regulator with XRE-family HTH domain